MLSSPGFMKMKGSFNMKSKRLGFNKYERRHLWNHKRATRCLATMHKLEASILSAMAERGRI